MNENLTTGNLTTNKKKSGMTLYEIALKKRNDSINSYINEKKKKLLDSLNDVVKNILLLISEDMLHEDIFLYINIVSSDSELCPFRLECFIMYGNVMTVDFKEDIAYDIVYIKEILHDKLNIAGIPFEVQEDESDLLDKEYVFKRCSMASYDSITIHGVPDFKFYAHFNTGKLNSAFGELIKIVY